VPEGFVVEFRARCAARFELELEPVAGIEAVLAGLEVPFCVASNGPREKMDVSLRVAGLRDYFGSRIVSAYEVGVFKPAPDLFLEAARVMGADPRRCAVIEDSVAGVRAGVAAEMSVFAYCPPNEFAIHRSEGATPFADMRELPRLLAGPGAGADHGGGKPRGGGVRRRGPRRRGPVMRGHAVDGSRHIEGARAYA
jgi:HAD superfamily hydrolase (TIGR01509 family)